MKVEIKYRFPDTNHITVTIGFIDYILTNEQYIDIIKQCSRIDGSGADYLIARNKLLTEYFINGPKEQFSW